MGAVTVEPVCLLDPVGKGALVSCQGPFHGKQWLFATGGLPNITTADRPGASKSILSRIMSGNFPHFIVELEPLSGMAASGMPFCNTVASDVQLCSRAQPSRC